MTRPIAMARFDLGWPLAGVSAAVVSALALGAMSAARGLPAWLPLNATSHVLHGPDAASTPALDLAHTGLGAAIHVGSCFFWAAVAVLLIRKARRGSAWQAWVAGLGTAILAGGVDYGLMPERLRPGWELVLPPLGVAAGLAAMGAGLALGLIAAQAIGADARPEAHFLPAPAGDPSPAMPTSEIERRRHPAPDVIDQRQQRVDPASTVTEDPNRHGQGY